MQLHPAWQDRVFEGGLAVLNMTVNAIVQPSLAHLPWLGALLVFGGALWLRHRAASRPRLRSLLGGVAGASWLALLVAMGLGWGRLYAGVIRESRSSFDDHFVFAADAQARLPAALLQDNERRALRLITSTPEFLIALGGDGRTVSHRGARRGAARGDLRSGQGRGEGCQHRALSSPEALGPHTFSALDRYLSRLISRPAWK